MREAASTMKQIKLLAAVMSGCLLAHSPQAMAFSGTELHRLCEDRSQGVRELSCLHFIRGVYEGFALGLYLGGGMQQQHHCPPRDGIAADQGRLVVQKYLRDHPEKLHEEATFLVAEALMRAFPCRKPN